jgi:molecular chaperone DnaJ
LVSVTGSAWNKRLVSEAARDYYEVLGVARDADTTTLKRAFRASARRLHPDVSAEPDADGKFRELADAYAVLSKPASRLLYDRFGYRGSGAWSGTPFDFWSRPKRSKSRVGDVGELELEFYEAARGGRRKVSYRSRGPCPGCDGLGTRGGGPATTCIACQGRGHVRESDESGAVRLLQLVKCDVCDGSGRGAEARCADCEGAGETEAERTVDVVIPSGVDDGTRLPLEGDLDGPQVVVRVRPQPADSAAVRAAAAAGLAAALAFLLFLFLR